MTTLHPFTTSRESVLPLWSAPVQSRRSLPDSRIPDLFVLLHGMLFTIIQLDDFTSESIQLPPMSLPASSAPVDEYSLSFKFAFELTFSMLTLALQQSLHKTTAFVKPYLRRRYRVSLSGVYLGKSWPSSLLVRQGLTCSAKD